VHQGKNLRSWNVSGLQVNRAAGTGEQRFVEIVNSTNLDAYPRLAGSPGEEVFD
jgi:hypothetical protein